MDDRKIEQDAVMALAVAVDVARRNPGASAREVDFDFFGATTGGVAFTPELLAQLKVNQSH